MGFLVLFFYSVASFSAVVDSNMVKMLDGRSAYCLGSRDANRAAYLPTELMASVSEPQEQLQIQFRVLSLFCEDSQGKFSWQPKSLWSDFFSQGIDGNAVLYKYEKLEFLIINDDYKIVFSTPVDDNVSQTLAPLLNLKQVLNKSQLGLLADGQVVTLSYEFFLRGVHVYSRDGFRFETLGQFSGGAYKLRLSLGRYGEKLQIRSISFQ